jgi:adenine/guanine phosphoribosyltransferase-like PRPP-binding protein
LVLPAVAAGWHCSWQSLPSHTGAFSPSVTKAKERSLLQETAVANIVQASRVFHTGAKAMERLLLRPQFDGPVTAGKAYVLVDDVICLGGTLAELADYIQAGGGQVAAVVTLVNAGRIKRLKP